MRSVPDSGRIYVHMLHLLRSWLLVAIASPAICQGAAASEQWLEWRGGSAQGHAAAKSLPTQLDPQGQTLQWRAAVRGRGISSPIVVDGRVFVTTAHRYEGGLLLVKTGAILLCSVLPLIAGALVLRRRATKADSENAAKPSGGSCRWVVSFDAALVAVASGTFIAFALAAHFAPDILWTLGRPGETWLVTGAIVFFGLAAASGWAHAGSRLRLLLTATLGAVSVLLWHGVPLDRYGIQHGALERARMLAPGLAFAGWSIATWRLARSRSTRIAKRRTTILSIGGGSIAAAALVLFLSVNGKSEEQLARSILCFDLASGAQLWERVLIVAPKEAKWPTNSYATPTPCSDGERVFAYYGAGWGCVDLDGNVLWTGTDPNYVAASRYGAGASPIFDHDQILLWQENEARNRRSYIVSFDARTGLVNWRVEPGDLHDSYSTPILVPRPNGERELISMAYLKLTAHSASNGARLWELPLPSRQPIPSLCYVGDDLLLVSGGTHLGFSTSGVRLHGAGSETRPEVLWQTRRNLSDVCSPVVGNGLYFTIMDGRMRCIDPFTGKIHWTGRLGAGDYWASLVAGDDKVYAVSGDGEVATVAMDASEFRVLSESTFDEQCLATPAVVEGRVIIRTESFLYCFGLPKDKAE